MHILFVTPAYPPFPGGGERYVRSLAMNLAGRGQRVTVVSSTARAERDLWQGRAGENEPHTTTPANPHVIRCPIRPMPGGRRGLLAWRKAMVVLSALPGEQTAVLLRMARFIPPIQGLEAALAALPEPVDIVHGFNISWEQALINGWQFARRADLPFVATPFAHLGAAGDDRVARNSTMAHQMALLRDADRVLTLTSVEREGLLARGLLPDRVVVIGGGLDPMPVLPDTAVVRQKYHLRQPYLIFIGRVSYEKGAIDAARAVLALRRAGEEVSLALVGQMAPEFERFYGRLSPEARERIRPLGHVSEEEKHALLDGATLLLLPSRTDSFGIVLLEAWAHGKPVIGARAGGIPGVIDEGENGLLVEFGDVEALQEGIGRLLHDGSLRQRLGRRGQQKVHDQYTWPRVTDRVLESYFSLV